jgi:hypothetical protein
MDAFSLWLGFVFGPYSGHTFRNFRTFKKRGCSGFGDVLLYHLLLNLQYTLDKERIWHDSSTWYSQWRVDQCT